LRSRSWREFEVEEAILIADGKIAELRRTGTTHASATAASLERMSHALRLALVAEVEERLLSRLHLRLETALRAADLLAVTTDEVPPSQRPTLPPPNGQTPQDIWDRAPTSERPTLRPARTVSEVVPIVRKKRASGDD
jgi:hypothetical protein